MHEQAKDVQKDKAREEKGRSPYERVRDLPQDLQWACTACGLRLGFVNRSKTEVRIKARDFFLTIEGGKLTHPCRNCGQMNELVDDGYLLWKAEKKSFDEFLANRRLFEEFLKKKRDFAKFLASKEESRMKGKTK